MADSSLAVALDGEASAFRQLLSDAVAVQASCLDGLVGRNSGSAFGRAHRFSTCRGGAQFADLVPVRGYDALASWIERAAAGEPGVLTTEPPVAFEETGGSTGGAKLVPCTRSGLAEFQAGLRPWLDDLLTVFPSLAAGRFYWSISPACRPSRTTAGGVPIGLDDTAYFGDSLMPLVGAALAVDPEVAGHLSVEAWRADTMAQLLRCRELAMISVWSPTFLAQLIEGHEGAELLERWPNLRVISCWDQAASAAPAAALRDTFPGVLVQGKGLLATEGLVTIPLAGEPWPVLSPLSGYYEFKSDDGAVVGIDAVRPGCDYELIVSNGNGFYRYAIGDRVRVRGFLGQAPTLEFLGRGHVGSDLCGEKLTEAFVLETLRPLGLRFSALAPDATAFAYALLCDAEEVDPVSDSMLTQRVDEGLSRNPQYAYARRVGQLGSIRVQRVSEPQARWSRLRQASGQRLGDIKPPALIGQVDLQTLLLP